MVVEGVLDALAVRGADALVQGQRLPQVCGTFAGVGAAELPAADSFQGPGFLQRGTYLPGNGQRLSVVVVSMAAGGRMCEQFAEVVQCLGLPNSVADLTVLGERALMARGCTGVVPFQSVDNTEPVKGSGFAVLVTQVAKQRQRSHQAGASLMMAPRLCVGRAQVAEGEHLPAPVTDVAEQLERPLVAAGGGWVIPGRSAYQP